MKHKINEQYFDTWSNEMAYILGLMASDGYVGKYKNGYVVGIESNDPEIINVVRNSLGEINIYEKLNSYVLNYHRKKLFESINKRGIHQNKSLNFHQYLKNILTIL